jgi:antitoxin PrlF
LAENVTGAGPVLASSIRHRNFDARQIKWEQFARSEEILRMRSSLNNALSQSKVVFMEQSTITDKFQTTIPLAVRRALKLSARQKITYEVRKDGTALIRPVPELDSLFGSLKTKRRAGTPREEKLAARLAMARDAAPEGLE